MTKNYKIFASIIALLLSILLFLLSISNVRFKLTPNSIARRVSHKIEKQIESMDRYTTMALSQEHWLELGNVPDDIVIYKYVQDTLQSWCNEFPISNDDIKSRTMLPYLVNPRFPAISPLSQVRDSLELNYLGSESFLLKSTRSKNTTIISGIHISDDALDLNDLFEICDLTHDSGAVVNVGGRDLFKIDYKTLTLPRSIDETLIWLSLAILLISTILYLTDKRSKLRLIIVLATFYLLLIAFYIFGRYLPESFIVFSSSLYSGGSILYSIGSVLLINLSISFTALCLYITRDSLFARQSSTPLFKSLNIIIFLLISLGILAYAFFTLKSVILHSNISLELYKIYELNIYCVIIYLSYILALLSIPLLYHTIRPLPLKKRIITSIAISLFLLVTSIYVGFQKEQKRLDELAHRLSFDRDTQLEIFLRNIEHPIANDAVISALSVFNNTASTIQNRIEENFMMRNDRNYSVTVYVFNSTNNTRASAAQYKSLLLDAESIGNNSRFMFVRKDNGHSYYIGVFMYLIEGSGISRVLVRLDTRQTQNSKGYAAIFGFAPPGQVVLPTGYSYANFSGRDLKNYRGSFAYPTKLSEELTINLYENSLKHFTSNGYTHFVTLVEGGKAVVLSRQTISIIDYLVMGIALAIITLLFLGILSLRQRNSRAFLTRGSYRSRIIIVVTVSLVLTMLLMTFVSVFFVISRNEVNNQSIILEKVSTITSSIEANLTNYNSLDDIDWLQLRRTLDKVGNDTNSDITLYSIGGKMIMSTIPMVFDMMILGDRIDSKAYGEIIHSNMRYSIVKGKWDNVYYYSMYATILGGDGHPIGIICSPYNSDTVNLETEALSHSMTIVTLFLAFLILSLFAVTRMIDALFQPLTQMSNKMNTAELESMEYLEYNRKDEVSVIVKAYNRMVKELSESTVKLAQAERDKAWSEMARQVAHEIKNPLTPMKLQLQRVLRLKEKNSPEWQDKFVDASKVLLDHIDILTETANEFSSFAKLYSEDNVSINLDSLLKEEIAMFDNNDNVVFTYIGLDNVFISGPKPQLTRVVVNLINNAIQALEGKKDGQIAIYLRNSADDGFYDIVFEDNGEGVKEENIAKLFTPNFTTKSSGSGLGLAISRSILERCGASIKYSRGRNLGGACFTIKYPNSSLRA